MWAECPEFARLLLCSDAHWESSGQSGGPLPTYFLSHAGGPVHGGGAVSPTPHSASGPGMGSGLPVRVGDARNLG